MYGDEMPEGTEIVEGDLVAATTAQAGEHVAASISTEDVRRAFYESADDPLVWVKDIRLDPTELIVQDDDDGELYRVPYDISGTEVTFGDPVASEIIYVDKNDAAVAASRRGRSVATFASRDESRIEQEQETTMDAKKIRASLGLAEDATDEEVFAAAERLKAAASDDANDQSDESTDDGDGDEDEEVKPDDEDGEDETSDEDNDVNASADTVSVDRKVFEETVAAARGCARRTAERTSRVNPRRGRQRRQDRSRVEGRMAQEAQGSEQGHRGRTRVARTGTPPGRGNQGRGGR